MSLEFRLQKEVAKVGTHKGKEVLRVRYTPSGHLTTDNICELISERSSLTSGDVKNVFDQINYLFQHFLANGYSIECGELGTFYPVIRSKDILAGEEFRQQKHIKGAKIVFRPKKRYNALLNPTFRKVGGENLRQGTCAVEPEADSKNEPKPKEKDTTENASGAGGL